MTKYQDYANIFFSNLAIKLVKNTEINKYVIKLLKDKQSLYKLIYTLNLVELENLKISIKTYLKTGVIWLSKSLANKFVLYNKKFNSSFFLCINY